MAEKIKVLIIDDSAIVRDVLQQNLSEHEDIEVVGTAPDPFIARDKIVKLKPDVLTLDIEMPKMDGLTFLKNLMKYYPIPVIIVSSVTAEDSSAHIKALEIGAFDVVNKPQGRFSVGDITDEIIFKIKQAYQLRNTYIARKTLVETGLVERPVVEKPQYLSQFSTTDKLIAIGASTGGTVAIEYLCKNLSGSLPPILIVQHMPYGYTKQFSIRLNQLSDLTVKEAEDNEIITSGTVYIAQGGIHLTVERRGNSLYTKFVNSERVHYQKPAVDVLFHSVAVCIGKNALGVLLTGMGKDGAEGLKKMREKGAITVAQDEKTSVVYGMPRAAAEINAAVHVLPLDSIPQFIVDNI